MGDENELSQTFEILGGDFGRAGSVSTKVKEILKEIGIDPSVIRRAAIVTYEAEMNAVMYARKALFTLRLTPGQIHLKIEDEGPGIADIDLAMQEGFSTATDEMREMGFGAGMGLPNIKKNADRFLISSLVGKGTMLSVYFYLNQEGNG
jgi:anti-sigma regulatory factor (Ser/Thr protein kinase)